MVIRLAQRMTVTSSSGLYRDRRLTGAQRRCTRAVETLAKVRKHLAAAVLLESRRARDVTPARPAAARLKSVGS